MKKLFRVFKEGREVSSCKLRPRHPRAMGRDRDKDEDEVTAQAAEARVTSMCEKVSVNQ